MDIRRLGIGVVIASPYKRTDLCNRPLRAELPLTGVHACEPSPARR